MTLLYLCCAWLVGIYAGSRWQVSGGSLWLIVPPLFVGLWLLKRYRGASRGALYGVIAILGALRMGAALPGTGPEVLAYYNGQTVLIRGQVIAEPDVRDTGVNLTVAADELRLGTQSLTMQGQILIHTSLYPQFVYGERLQAEGYLETPPVFDDFSYRDYLAQRGVLSLMSYPHLKRLEGGHQNPLADALYHLREHAQATVARIFSGPEAALLSGILLGTARAIPKALQDSFNATGTSHIIVISGFNITILATALSRVANRWLPRRAALLVSLAGVAAYTLFVGAGVSVVRAAVMGGLALVAVLFGRQSHALTALAFAALLMTLLDPFTLWDIGFQLSAGATLGLVLFATPWYNRTHQLLGKSGMAQSVMPLLKETLITTLAAQVFTLPLTIYYFHRLSLVMPIANVLVLPAQPGLMLTGAAAALAGSIWLPVGRIVGWVAWLFLTYTVRVVEALSSVPFASVEVGQIPSSLVVGYFAVVALAWWGASQSKPKQVAWWHIVTRNLSTKAILLTLLLAALVVWSAVFSLPDGFLHVRFLNVGQGDAILVTTPTGQQIIIDGGPAPAIFLSELGRAMPIWDHKIEMIFLSHPDKDHLTGLVPLLERYEVGQVIDSIVDDPSPLSASWQQSLRERGIPVQRARTGLRVVLGDGGYIDLLSPQAGQAIPAEPDTNDLSTILRLVYGQTSFLFTGDLGEEGESILLQSGQALSSTVLKVSHHGASKATTEPFLRAVAPQLAVISVGENKFGHPAKDTLARLAAVPTLRTDKLGTIDIVTDGKRVWTSQSP